MAQIRSIAEKTKGAARKDVLDACEKRGLKRTTAATIYQQWKAGVMPSGRQGKAAVDDTRVPRTKGGKGWARLPDDGSGENARARFRSPDGAQWIAARADETADLIVEHGVRGLRPTRLVQIRGPATARGASRKGKRVKKAAAKRK